MLISFLITKQGGYQTVRTQYITQYSYYIISRKNYNDWSDVQLSERLASWGSPSNITKLYGMEEFKGALNWTSIMPTSVSFPPMSFFAVWIISDSTPWFSLSVKIWDKHFMSDSTPWISLSLILRLKSHYQWLNSVSQHIYRVFQKVRTRFNRLWLKDWITYESFFF